MKQIEISTTSWEQLHQLRYTLVRGKILPSRAAVVDELLRQYWREGDHDDLVLSVGMAVWAATWYYSQQTGDDIVVIDEPVSISPV